MCNLSSVHNTAVLGMHESMNGEEVLGSHWNTQSSKEVPGARVVNKIIS